MNAPHIDHIGILVADLDAAIGTLRPLFGAPTRTKILAEVGLRVAEFAAANVTVELLQYDGPAEFARQVMGEQLGLNHISARVANVAQALGELSSAGLRPMQGFPRQGAHGQVAFFEPDPVTGLRFEICQPDAKEE
jgi:catechol 2,3-dioxygenase-like lactoylglutathione lyase family enzyme